ncbi:homocysteine S-methyltransferase, partial [Lutimonas sp.]|uniref:homocysteine S-methyltransferase n=1 Tax=Lutimonas sp. TaxID=1872403 RepID=UPI003C70D95D
MQTLMLTKIKYPLILDGGLSNVLEGFGCDLNHRLWSARLLIDEPELILRAHLTYLEAGANLISSAGYQASLEGFIKTGLSPLEAERLILRSVELAEEARDIYLRNNNTEKKIYIAASMGPYGAILADGSEYRGHYAISEKALKDFHAKRIELLATSNADFFGFETIPSMPEVKVLSELLSRFTKPSWISFSCKDELHLNDGNKISEAAKLLVNNTSVFAIGVNCTSPKYISGIIEVLKQSVPEKKIIVYPNSGEVYHVQSKSWLGVSDPFSFEKMAQEWREKGADIIGGCCRIGP